MSSFFKSFKFIIGITVIAEFAVYGLILYFVNGWQEDECIEVKVPAASLAAAAAFENRDLNESDINEAAALYELHLACYLYYLETFYPAEDEDYVGIIPLTRDLDHNLASMYGILERLRRKISAYEGLESSRCGYSVYLWEALFDENEEASRPLGYLGKGAWRRRCLRALQAIGLPLLLKEADYLRSADLHSDKPYSLPAPDFVKTLTKKYKPGNGYVACEDMMFLQQVLLGRYRKIRAYAVYSEISESLKKCGYSLSGKDILDVGSALGSYMPYLKMAVGGSKRPTGTNIDYLSVYFSILLNSDLNIRNYVCRSADWIAEPDSFDVITMVSVYKEHLGSSRKNNYAKEALPWIESMHSALRKDGVLVVHENNEDFIKQGMEQAFIQCGFKKIGFFRYDKNFVFVFKVEK